MCWLLHKLMIGLLVIHTIGGCCLHHAHAWDAIHTAQDPACSGGHDAPCGSGSHEEDEPEAPCDDRFCDFVVPAKAEVDESLIARDLFGAAVLPQAADPPAVVSTRRVPLHRSWPQAGIRLHLVHQVLLI